MNKIKHILILLSFYFTTVQTSEEKLFNFELSNEQNENSFKLPDEIQLRILDYVDPEFFKLMPFVCKKMHNLCNDKSLQWNRTHSKIMDDIEMFSIAVQEDKKHITLFFKGVYGFFSNQEHETYARQLNQILHENKVIPEYMYELQRCGYRGYADRDEMSSNLWSFIDEAFKPYNNEYINNLTLSQNEKWKYSYELEELANTFFYTKETLQIFELYQTIYYQNKKDFSGFCPGFFPKTNLLQRTYNFFANMILYSQAEIDYVLVEEEMYSGKNIFFGNLLATIIDRLNTQKTFHLEAHHDELLNQYLKVFIENSHRIYCSYDTVGSNAYFKDFLQRLENTNLHNKLTSFCMNVQTNKIKNINSKTKELILNIILLIAQSIPEQFSSENYEFINFIEQNEPNFFDKIHKKIKKGLIETHLRPIAILLDSKCSETRLVYSESVAFIKYQIPFKDCKNKILYCSEVKYWEQLKEAYKNDTPIMDVVTDFMQTNNQTLSGQEKNIIDRCQKNLDLIKTFENGSSHKLDELIKILEKEKNKNKRFEQLNSTLNKLLSVAITMMCGGLLYIGYKCPSCIKILFLKIAEELPIKIEKLHKLIKIKKEQIELKHACGFIRK